MPRLTDILLFIFANALGFFSAHICYLIGTLAGLIPIGDPAFDPSMLRGFFHGIIMTWIVCAIFSLAFFFFKGKTRTAFLLAPVVIPLAYGLRVLLLF